MVLKIKGTPPPADALLDVITHLIEVDVTGHDVDVAVYDGDKRLVHIGIGYAARFNRLR